MGLARLGWGWYRLGPEPGPGQAVALLGPGQGFGPGRDGAGAVSPESVKSINVKNRLPHVVAEKYVK